MPRSPIEAAPVAWEPPADAALQRASLDALEQGVILATLDGQVRVANRAAERILGYAAAELTRRHRDGTWMATRLDGSRLPPEEQPLLHTIATATPAVEWVIGWRRPDGLIYLRVSTEPVRDPDDVLVAVVAAFTDVTEQMASQRAREEAEAALRASSARFAALVERSRESILVVDERGRITYTSPAGEQTWGPAPAHGTAAHLFDRIHPDDRGPLVAEVTGLLASPGRSQTYSCRARAMDGTWRHVEISATNHLDDPDVAGVVCNVRDVTERAEAAARLTWQAYHDPLTSLPNRALLAERLARAVETSRGTDAHLALLFIDIDRFKAVNDTLGHDAGDQLLEAVAQRIVDAVRGDDTVARFGGDEFVVLVEGVDDPEEVTYLADRIGAEIARPVPLAQGEVTVSTSIGIAFDDGHEPEDLLRDADIALYRAKERGKDRYEVFDDSLRVAALRRLTMERELREGLARGDMAVHFQPIFDLSTGVTAAAEALLRIPRAGGGHHPPADHIAVADDSGLILPLGEMVLDEACRALARWRSSPGAGAPGQVTVNVTGRQLASSRFASLVASTLERHGLHPEDLVLELTESTVIGADEATVRTVDRLTRTGVVLAIDDFGTGYSSLAYLKRFPITVLKLDRAFVAGLGTDHRDTEIVRAVVSLGLALGMRVVAEGIETEGQLERLRAMGCQQGQGFLLGWPGPATDLAVHADRSDGRFPPPPA